MNPQIVHQFECYGNERAPKGINDFLTAHPTYRIASVTAVSISYAGGETSGGVLVVFEEPAAERE